MQVPKYAKAHFNATRRLRCATPPRPTPARANPSRASSRHPPTAAAAPTALLLAGSKLVASCATAKAIVLSPVPFAVRALSQFLADVALDAARWACGTLDKATLRQNATIKAYRYAATGGLQYVCACLLPFAFAAPVPPLPFLFIVTDLVGAFAAEAVVGGSPV